MNWLIATVLLMVVVVVIVGGWSGGALPPTKGDRYEADLAPGGEVKMRIQSSDLRIVGSDENKIRVHYWGDRRTPSGVSVQLNSSGKTAKLNIQGGPSSDFHVEVQVPKRSDLYARMFAGEMNVSGISGDKDVEVNTGKLTVIIENPSDYRRVDGAVLTGNLNGEAFGVAKGGLFRSFEQKGPGEYRLHARVGAGELRLVPSGQ